MGIQIGPISASRIWDLLQGWPRANLMQFAGGPRRDATAARGIAFHFCGCSSYGACTLVQICKVQITKPTIGLASIFILNGGMSMVGFVICTLQICTSVQAPLVSLVITRARQKM